MYTTPRKDAVLSGERGPNEKIMAAEEKPKRLCSEIQLFDLCEKTKCGKKDGRFCTDESMLNKFEAINQDEDFPPEQYLADEQEEDVEGIEDEAFLGDGDRFDDDEDDPEEEF
jgi:hypothetical protein